jgi:Mitochondrial carrier protein
VQVKRNVSQPFTAAFMAGGVAGAVSRTVVSPLERLKILYQVQSVGRSEYQMSIYNALKKMWMEEGWRGFMRGNGTNCVRIIPYSAVQFGSYNIYKRVRNISQDWPLVLISTSLQNPHQGPICRRYGDWFVVAAQALPL